MAPSNRAPGSRPLRRLRIVIDDLRHEAQAVLRSIDVSDCFRFRGIGAAHTEIGGLNDAFAVKSGKCRKKRHPRS
jgi:hypothetical protein